jgi:hypothetical protein
MAGISCYYNHIKEAHPLVPDLFTTFIVAYRIASCPYQMFIPSFLRLPENCLGKDGFPHCDFIHSPWRYSHAFHGDYG